VSFSEPVEHHAHDIQFARRLCFSRQQGWEQRKSAKTLVFTVAFAVASGLALAALIRLLYYHKK